MIRTNLIRSALTAAALTLGLSAAQAQMPSVNGTNNTAVATPFFYGAPYVGQVSGVFGYPAVPLGVSPLGSPFGIPFGILAGAPIGGIYVSGFSGPPPGYFTGNPGYGG